MPTIHNIPSRTEHHCEPCEFHKCTGSMHVRSGEGGWREYACMHSQAFRPLPTPTNPEKARIIERLEAMQNEGRHIGRHIGRTEKQPNWCPLKRALGEI